MKPKQWEAEIVIYDYVIDTFWAWKLKVKRPNIVVEGDLLYDIEADAMHAARRTLRRLGLVERKEK